MVYSPSDVINDVRQQIIVDDEMFLHYDLNGFYMMGDLKHHVRCCDLRRPQRFRSLLKDVLDFLPRHQFVRAVPQGVRYYKMVLGEGQGLVHGGAVASASLAQHVELNNLALACRATQHKYGIMFYRRLADNLFSLSNAIKCMRCWGPFRALHPT